MSQTTQEINAQTHVQETYYGVFEGEKVKDEAFNHTHTVNCSVLSITGAVQEERAFMTDPNKDICININIKMTIDPAHVFLSHKRQKDS